MGKVFLYVSLFLFTPLLYAQSNQEENDWLNTVFTESQIQELTPKEIDYWISLHQNPKNLNSLKSIDLQVLFSLTYEEIKLFEKYKSQFGKWISTRELSRLGWDEYLLRLIQGCTFVSIEDQEGITFKEALASPDQHYTVANVGSSYPLSKGFNSKHYKGLPIQFQQRFRWSRKNQYSFGLTLQHDAGEIWTWSPQNSNFGIDFLSAHLCIKEKGIFKEILVGDYQMIGGQGLVFGGGYFLGKGGDPILNITRGISESRPYTSVTESGFLRGITTTLQPHENISITLLGSYNQLNASTTSTVSSGLHRTENEQEDRSALLHQAFGGRIKLKQNKLLLGSNFLMNHYGREIEVDRKDSLSVFRGAKAMNISFDAHYYWKNISWFSELAYSNFGGLAGILSTYISMSKSFDLVLSYRNYAYNYITMYGNALSEGIRSTNERGVYVGYKWRKAKKVSLQGYFDLFHIPYPTYKNDGGIEGVEISNRLDYHFNASTSFFCSLKWKDKGRYWSAPNDKKSSYLKESVSRIILGIALSKEKVFKLKPSIQVKYFNGINESYGFLLAQDFSFHLFKKLTLDGRLAVFQTDDYNARLYSYEKNVQYSFSFPPYYGKGMKSFLMLKYKMSGRITITGRWAKTTYDDRETISSGWNEVEGNEKNDVVLQLKLVL